MKHVARKRFGQNFLVDASVPERMIEAIAPKSGEAFVEIGPGLGALTLPLSRRLGKGLDVIELDRDLVARLESRGDLAGLVVHASDVLRFDFRALAGLRGQTLRVVGNLPYNISSPLLFHLQEQVDAVRDQHFMLQKEVVERMVASPASAAYGRLSVMLQVVYEMDLLFEVPPEAFDPAPAVTSAVVRMQPWGGAAPRIDDRPLFERLVRDAFGQRRKMIRNSLAHYDETVPLLDVGLSPTARPEEIPVASYVEYANALAEAGVRG